MRGRGAVLGLALVAGLLAPPGTAGAQTAAAACPEAVPSAGFADISPGYLHEAAVDCVVWWDVARGTGQGQFSPAAPVTRGQLASFVARTVRRSGGALASSPADAFRDDDHSTHHFSINRLAQAGVVEGRDGQFHADATVTRAQLAAFLVRTYEHRTGLELPSAGNAFTDDDGSVHEASIDKAAAAGLTRGSGPGTYSPSAPVHRGQLASFLASLLQALVETGQVEDTPATLRTAAALATFDACEPLLSHVKERAVEQVGPYGWDGGFWGGPVPVSEPAPSPAMPDGESGGGDAGSGGAPHSGTNNQEADVDEADVVKTDGRTVWSVVDGQLRAVDVTGAQPRLAGTLALPAGYDSELLVAGRRALVLTTGYSGHDGPRPASVTGPGGEGTTTSVTWVDLSDPAAMRVEGVLQVEGAAVAARLAGGVARLVVRGGLPQLDFVYPQDGSTEAFDRAAQHNRRAVETSTIDDWLPRYRLEDRRTDAAVVTEAALYGCTSLHRPPEHSGLDTIDVLTLDPALPPHAGKSTGVLTDGDLVYASAQSLYVATTRWGWQLSPDSAETVTTALHAFSLADRDVATYRASGKVDGLLLNQFAMSEHEGHLRVATTSLPTWWGPPPDGEQSESSVHVLAEQGGALTPVGRVDGLGIGERIRAVRFLGDQAYVVTFRQVDPLYTLDLSEPTSPRVVGELKILGYSAYLHPVGPGLLLGVGQDATEQGETLGVQLSLFDVSDPAAPRRLHALGLGEGTGSDVEFDHRAFLHWPTTGLTILPVTRFRYDEQTQTEDVFVGAVGVEVDAAEGFTRLGEISHGTPSWNGEPTEDPRWPGISRSVVVGETVYTLSERGVKASDVATLAERAWLPFPAG